MSVSRGDGSRPSPDAGTEETFRLRRCPDCRKHTAQTYMNKLGGYDLLAASTCIPKDRQNLDPCINNTAWDILLAYEIVEACRHKTLHAPNGRVHGLPPSLQRAGTHLAQDGKVVLPFRHRPKSCDCSRARPLVRKESRGKAKFTPFVSISRESYGRGVEAHALKSGCVFRDIFQTSVRHQRTQSIALRFYRTCLRSLA